MLARGDAERLLRFVAEAERFDDDGNPFSGDLLAELGRLVSADWISYVECDHGRTLVAVDRTGDAWDGWADAYGDGVLWGTAWEEHPVRLRHHRGDFRALMISNFLTQRELRRARLYDVCLRPWGIGHSLNVRIPSPLCERKTFLFDRAKRPFSERDRLVLDLLRPHFGRLWQAARTRRLVASALAAHDQADVSEMRGVILLGAGGKLEYMSPAARRLVREFLPEGRSPTGSIPAHRGG